MKTKTATVMVIGGGHPQLSLIEAIHDLNLSVWIVDDRKNLPSASLADIARLEIGGTHVTYGFSRTDVEQAMDSFPIACRKDEAAHGFYKTKEEILAAYDELTAPSKEGKELKPLRGEASRI